MNKIKSFEIIKKAVSTKKKLWAINTYNRMCFVYTTVSKKVIWIFQQHTLTAGPPHNKDEGFEKYQITKKKKYLLRNKSHYRAI